eukprot:Skav221552  [mRNA]  locus=scaffold1376:66996:68857:- [translate_table: standard]
MPSEACDTLRDYQALVFTCFMCGWVIYFIASVLQVWIFYKKSIATFVSIPFCIFTLAIIWYTFHLRWKLSLPEDQVVSGKIAHFQRYESIGDIADGLPSSSATRVQSQAEQASSPEPSPKLAREPGRWRKHFQGPGIYGPSITNLWYPRLAVSTSMGWIGALRFLVLKWATLGTGWWVLVPFLDPRT